MNTSSLTPKWRLVSTRFQARNTEGMNTPLFQGRGRTPPPNWSAPSASCRRTLLPLKAPRMPHPKGVSMPEPMPRRAVTNSPQTAKSCRLKPTRTASRGSCQPISAPRTNPAQRMTRANRAHRPCSPRPRRRSVSPSPAATSRCATPSRPRLSVNSTPMPRTRKSKLHVAPSTPPMTSSSRIMARSTMRRNATARSISSKTIPSTRLRSRLKMSIRSLTRPNPIERRKPSSRAPSLRVACSRRR